MSLSFFPRISAVFFPVICCAAALASPDLENAPHKYLGQVTGSNVFVRSGPSETDYQTMKMDRGQQVTVAGIKGDYLKIEPPAGSFSYVAKSYVERFGDGSSGRVTRDNLRVLAGSSLTTLKAAPQCTLKAGDVVRILGEVDEYFKIEPPAAAYVWIHKDYVQPIRLIDSGGGHRAADAGGSAGVAEVRPSPATRPADAETVAASDTEAVADGVDPSTRPSPEVAAAESLFEKTEAAFRAALGDQIREALDVCGMDVAVIQQPGREIFAQDPQAALTGRHFDLAEYSSPGRWLPGPSGR